MASDDTPLKPQCEDALHEIYHLLAGEITDAKREQIAGHLDECAPCAEPYDFYAELRQVRATALPRHGPARAARAHPRSHPARTPLTSCAG